MGDSKFTERDHLEQAAKQGSAAAQAELDGPEIPERLGYLRAWAGELYGRSGVGMSGFAPLTYTTIADWSRLKGIEIRSWEVDVLLVLDSVMLFPGKE